VTDPAASYGREVGDDALERQRKLAAELHRCCGEWREGPHHLACKNYVEPEAPAVIDGQESLL
jgi:hypothetical protein